MSEDKPKKKPPPPPRDVELTHVRGNFNIKHQKINDSGNPRTPAKPNKPTSPSKPSKKK